MDIDGMTITETPGSPCLLTVLGDENDGRCDLTGRKDLQSLSLFCDSLAYGGNNEIIPHPSFYDGRLYSTSLGQQDEMPGSLQLREGNIGPADFYDCSQSQDKYLSSSNQVEERSEERRQCSNNAKLASKRKPARMRRQNRSCDPCRSAKRACDLPFDPMLSRDLALSPCSMCKLRGADCTVVWRTKKQSSNTGNKYASASFVAVHEIEDNLDAINEQRSESVPPPAPLVFSTHECSLVSGVTRCEKWSERLAVYLDVFDIPLSNLLSGGCMLPCHSVGVAALASLGHKSNMTATIDRTQSSIKDSWKMDTSPHLPTCAVPRLFVMASILDTIFQPLKPRRGNLRHLSHDNDLTEVFKWVAIATGSQFDVCGSISDGNTKCQKQARDIAYAAWQKAKNMVFTKIAARKSFRLGLSLLLFGTIQNPTGTDRSHEFEDDSTYALQEGISRLRTLCSEARIHLIFGEEKSILKHSSVNRSQSPHASPLFANLRNEEAGGLLDLIVALEWLVDITQSVSIALFPNRDLAITPPILEPNTNITGHPIGNEFQGMAIEVLDETINLCDREETKSVTKLLSQRFSDSIVQSTLSESGSLVVLLWKSLARLTLAARDMRNGISNFEEISQHFDSMLILLGIWRTKFGALNPSTTKQLKLATADMRRSVIFCATDGDLAVLIFHKLSCQIERYLASRPQPSNENLRERMHQTRTYRNFQRLTSAMQMSSLASAVQGSSSPGFQGELGLKANIEDITAHPHPTMVVQAYQLSATTLAEEIRSSVSAINEERLPDLSIALHNCLRELRGLRKTLVMYPFKDQDSDDEDFGPSSLY